MAAWYNTAWKYALPVTVTNTSSTSALSYCQVPIALTGSAYTSLTTHGQPGLADLVVTDSDGVTPLSFALEQIDTTSSIIYLLVKVSIPADSSKTIYVYYGNAAASSTSNYGATVGPGASLPAAVDVVSQSMIAGANGNTMLILLQHQAGANASLNGSIYAVAMTGSTTAQPFTQSHLSYSRSTDGGHTWSAPVDLTAGSPPGSGYSYLIRGLGERQDGAIILAYSYGLTSQASTVSPNFVAISTDGGTSFTNLTNGLTPLGPADLNSLIGLGQNCCPYGPILVDGLTGSLMMAYYAVSGTNPNYLYSSYVLSCPAGSDPTVAAHWSIAGKIVDQSSTQVLNETCLAQVAPGKYLAVLRSDITSPSNDRALRIATSGSGGVWQANSGTAWNTPAALANMPGLAGASTDPSGPWLIPLASGNLLLAWSLRYSSQVVGIGCCVSTDGGTTWLDRAIALPYSKAVSGQAVANFGYPSMVQNADGTIALSWYYDTGNSSTAWNVGSVKLTEDWVVNSPNQYDACQSFGSAWSGVGAGSSVSSAHTLNGATNALKFDNSSTYPANGTRTSWSTDAAVSVPKVGFACWYYPTQIDPSWDFGFEVVDSGGRFRVLVESVGTATAPGVAGEVEWYNGTYNDIHAATPLSRWTRQDHWLNAQASSVAGAVVVGTAAPVAGSSFQFQTGGSPQGITWIAGHSSSTTATTFYLGSFYTHQYVAAVPTLTVGAELVAPGLASWHGGSVARPVALAAVDQLRPYRMEP